jgi:pantoate--beta-alanine ligase
VRMITNPKELQTASRTLRKAGKNIGFVPTMGYFHEGHLSLMREAKRKNDVLVVSIYVNPRQFGPGEDFDRYPRDMNRDNGLALEVGVDYLFCPSNEDMYPEGYSTSIQVQGLTGVLCGAFRPGHFDGVATVVLKLLNIVRPHQAFFGQKDYQQFVVIRRMVADLNLDLEVVSLPTVREPSGLAMSSRNVNLGSEDAAAAANIYRALQAAERTVSEQKEIAADRILRNARQVLGETPQVRVQYLELRDAETLAPVEVLAAPAVLAIAAFVGEVRLIDNILIQPPTA